MAIGKVTPTIIEQVYDLKVRARVEKGNAVDKAMLEVAAEMVKVLGKSEERETTNETPGTIKRSD